MNIVEKLRDDKCEFVRKSEGTGKERRGGKGKKIRIENFQADFYSGCTWYKKCRKVIFKKSRGSKVLIENLYTDFYIGYNIHHIPHQRSKALDHIVGIIFTIYHTEGLSDHCLQNNTNDGFLWEFVRIKYSERNERPYWDQGWPPIAFVAMIYWPVTVGWVVGTCFNIRSVAIFVSLRLLLYSQGWWSI